MASFKTLGEAFSTSAERWPQRPALVVGGETHTYASLYARAGGIARAISEIDSGDTGLCAVLGGRTAATYAGILGTLLAGRGYVPLNPKFPAERNRRMLDLSTVSTIVVAAEDLEILREVLTGIDQTFRLVVSEPSGSDGGIELPQISRIVEVDPDRRAIGITAPSPADPNSVAYLLFTSGTTGAPKGIGIRHTSVVRYVEVIAERYGIGPTDRFSQNFDLTFDLSIHDMFVCWSRGACLCVPGLREVMAPARFVRDQELTCWFSTPSTAALMQQMRMLQPGSFPSLRWSLFCGEALALSVAEAWQRAAPASVVENLYGPTEATIAFTAYQFDLNSSPDECVNGVVPIGRPFGENLCAIVDGEGEPVKPGSVGELVLAGAQLAPGYWHDTQRSDQAFVRLPALDPQGPWYRTGDLAAFGGDETIAYHGRVDDQIKIRGYRVELQEIEAVAREACADATVVALGWPRTDAGADGIILFLTDCDTDDNAILRQCADRLPEYMVPREIHRISSMPLNVNGKVDRRALLQMRENQG